MPKFSILPFLLCCVPLLSGEYSAISPGLAVDVGKTTGSSVTAFQNTSGNIQGGTVDWGFGIGFTAPIRLGEVVHWSLSRVELVPTVAVRFGRNSDGVTQSNLTFWGADGSLTVVQDATLTRTTQTREVVVSMPLRVYLQGAAAYGGFYVEAGPLGARTEEQVKLRVSGQIQAQAVNIEESSTLRQTDTGYCIGLGVTQVDRGSQFSYGLQIRSLPKKAITTNQVQINASWTF